MRAEEGTNSPYPATPGVTALMLWSGWGAEWNLDGEGKFSNKSNNLEKLRHDQGGEEDSQQDQRVTGDRCCIFEWPR